MNRQTHQNLSTAAHVQGDRDTCTDRLTRISALQPMSRETINILDREGSRGNSTICLPRGVRDPVLSRAPVIHSWYIEFRILS